jgi:hypothetical protein
MLCEWQFIVMLQHSIPWYGTEQLFVTQKYSKKVPWYEVAKKKICIVFLPFMCRPGWHDSG